MTREEILDLIEEKILDGGRRTTAAFAREVFDAIAENMAMESELGSTEEVIQIACSDLTTAITTGTNKGYDRMPHAGTLTAVRASLITASTSGAVTIDILKNGVSIFSTKLTIDANEETSVTAAVAYVLSTTALADDDKITVSIDGAGTGAKGLIVTLFYTKA